MVDLSVGNCSDSVYSVSVTDEAYAYGGEGIRNRSYALPGGSKRQKSSRKGYQFLNIGRLTKRNLAENKKKSTITIVSMAVTGIFVMMVATVLSCANPMESAKSSIVGQYEISPIVESGNKEHPEYEWAEVQKNNPLNEGLKQQIEELDGVERVDVFTALKVSGGPFEEKLEPNLSMECRKNTQKS